MNISQPNPSSIHSTPMVNGFDHPAVTTTSAALSSLESDSSIGTTSVNNNSNTTASSEINTSQSASSTLTTTTTTILPSLATTLNQSFSSASSNTTDTSIITKNISVIGSGIPGSQPTEEETAVQAVRNHVESLKHTGKDIFFFTIMLYEFLH